MVGINKAVDRLNVGLANLRRECASTVELLGLRARDQAVRALQEETQVLWWLFVEHSLSARKSFKQLSAPSEGLFLGIDVADLTRFVPPHAHSGALLDRAAKAAFGSNDEATLEQVAEAVSPELLRTLGSTIDGREMATPILAAVHRASTGSGGSWRKAFEIKSGIGTKQRRSIGAWAAAATYEVTLRKVYANGA